MAFVNAQDLLRKNCSQFLSCVKFNFGLMDGLKIQQNISSAKLLRKGWKCCLLSYFFFQTAFYHAAYYHDAFYKVAFIQYCLSTPNFPIFINVDVPLCCSIQGEIVTIFAFQGAKFMVLNLQTFKIFWVRTI